MITTAIITLAYLLISSIIGLLPAGAGFPTGFHTAITSLGGYLHILDPLVPISILLTCLSLIFSVEIAVFGFKTIKWIISHIPWIGGKGN
jgi:hypothetical protein